jgi:CRISPR system Cascade subunit CasC
MDHKRLFLDIHAIQTLPPSNINRDDTGSPKTAQYGGVTRARVSSQAWKKAMRDYFRANGGQADVGVRTKQIVKYVAEKIVAQDASVSMDDAMKKAEAVFKAVKVGIDKDKAAKALFFLGNRQAEALAEAALNDEKDKKRIEEFLNHNPEVDIALFGRMVADNPVLNEDASAQVAHAISTHAVQTEFDYFTALDDLHPEDNAGAGMLGTIEYNSATLYRYANVALHELAGQLGDAQAAAGATKLLIEAFANAMPTGKVNTFANQTLPEALLIVLREDRPVSLVSAFEAPIRSQEGYVQASIKRLAEECAKVERFVRKPLLTLYVTLDSSDLALDGKREDSLSDLLEDYAEQMPTLLPEESR